MGNEHRDQGGSWVAGYLGSWVTGWLGQLCVESRDCIASASLSGLTAGYLSMVACDRARLAWVEPVFVANA